MTDDSADREAPAPAPFEVFRSDSSSRLPGQRFPASEPPASTARSGPTAQRRISDAAGALAEAAERRPVTLGSGPDKTPPASPASAAIEPLTLRVQTYSLNLADRIARVRAEQQEALESLQRLSEGSPPAGGVDADDQKPNRRPPVTE